MNLVDDDRVDGAQRLGGLRGEQQVERLGRGDEDLGGMAGKARALPLRRVAGANADGRLAEGDAHAAGHVGHAGQRRAQVALHVDGESLEGRNVDDAAALLPVRWKRMEHEPIQAPEEGGESFAGAGGGQDERILSARNHRPAHPLRGGGGVKDGAKPGCRDRMEAGKRIGVRVRVGPVAGHAPLRIARWRRRSERQRSEIRGQRSGNRDQESVVSMGSSIYPW